MPRWLPVLAIAAGIASCSAERPTSPTVRPVRSMVVADASQFTRRSFPGKAKATQEINLAFEVGGRLIERPVDIGSEVRRGDLLARLDPRDFQNALDAAVAERDRAKAFFERVDEARPSGAVSEQDVTDARARLNQAEARVQIRTKALADSELLAPFDGTISATYVENFQNVLAKQQLMRLLDTTRIEMPVFIPETLISLVPYVQDIQITFDVYPDRPIPATVKEVSNEASLTTRTYMVTLIMDPPDDMDIKPGMAASAYGEAVVPDDLSESGYEVPASSLFTPADAESQDSYVWVIDPETSTVKRRQIEIVRFGSRGAVVSGVEPGERIATAGVHFLVEGQNVQVQAQAEVQ